MSPGLVHVVDELAVIHHASEESLTVEEAREWLGKDVDAVLERGLGVLGESRLRQLLVRPSLLPGIQELVLVEGGGYWSALMPVARGRMPTTVMQKPMPRWLLMAVPLALAASVAAFIAVDTQRQPAMQPPIAAPDLVVMRGTDTSPHNKEVIPHKPWGWNRDDLLAAEIGPANLPGRLADALSEWFRVTASDGGDLNSLRLHLSEVWAGCQQVRLQTADVTPPELCLKVSECVTLLEERMQNALGTLRGQLDQEGTAETASRTKSQVDAWIQETINALRAMQKNGTVESTKSGE
jgi:hypothetical protein